MEKATPDEVRELLARGREFTERKTRFEVQVTWYRDPVPGWNHQPEDVADMLYLYLIQTIPHYNPSVEIREEEK